MTAPFAAPGSFVTDGDQFSPPLLGGSVAVKFGSYAYTDTTAKVLFTLPAGAVIVDFYNLVTTAFNDSGTDLVDIGMTGAAAAFADDLSVAAAGLTRAGATNTVVTSLLGTPLAADTDVIATFTGQNANASAGAATFCIEYILR